MGCIPPIVFFSFTAVFKTGINYWVEGSGCIQAILVPYLLPVAIFQDETPPFTVPTQVRMRRQSALPTTSGLEKFRTNRRQSAPPQIRTDISTLHKKLKKLRETSSLKGETVEEEEFTDEQVAGKLAPPILRDSYKPLKMTETSSSPRKIDLDHVRGESHSEPTSPLSEAVSSRRRPPVVNIGQRGSVVVIDDDDKPIQSNK